MLKPGPDSRPLGDAERDVSFSILGPLEVRHASGTPIPVSSTQERTLLAALLLEPNRVVTLPALIDALWPDNPPAAAQNAVQVNVSRLRDRLEPDRKKRPEASGVLLTRPRGYQIAVAARQLDSLRFERLVAAGRAALPADPRRAAGCLEDALTLWTGRPLGELGSQPFAVAWANDMEELWLAAVEGLVDARLALGRHAELTAELAHLVTEHPLHEGFRAQQMRVLYRCGRAPEALAVYRSARRALNEELGVEPGPELRELERAILRHDLALIPPPRQPSPTGPTAAAPPPTGAPVAFVCALWDPAPAASWHAPGDWELALLAEDGGGRVLAVDVGRMVASFAGIGAALTAAAALAADRGRPARLAVHAGESLALGHRSVGPAGARTQRLAGAAHPGQVLVSDAAAELTRAGLPDGMALAELGAPRLSGLGRPEPLHQLTHARLAADFPALRSLDAVPNNLPTYPDSFVGREREIAEVARLLEGTRLLTLVGPGGCGKTRAAVQAAAELLPGFGDGAFVVELATLSDPRLVPAALATALGIPQNPRLPMTEVVARHLGSAQTLLVLDSCEHLVDACADLAQTLIDACDELRILATSRQRLGARGEVVWTVPPLELPGAGDALESDAARLLVDRASALLPDLQLGPAGGIAVVRICSKLAGIPLAIELAAARVPALGLDAVADRLDAAGGESGLKLLRGGASGPERHRTMELALDWSYQLLSPDERLLLTRMGVIAGGVGIDDVIGIGAGDGIAADDLPDLLARLVEKSMVVAEPGGDGLVRYRLLDPIRDYAAAKLAASGDADAVRSRHAEWFLGVAEEADEELHGPDERHWLERLEAAHDNLRAALGWAIDGGHADTALRLTGALWWFWYTHGHLSEGRDWLDRALALPAPAAARIKPLHAAAHLACWQGDFARTITGLTEMLENPAPGDDRWSRAWATMGLAAMATLTGGDLDEGLELAEQSAALHAELRSDWELGYSVMTLGYVRLYRSEYVLAAEALDDTIAIFRAGGQTPALASALRYRGLAAQMLGDHARATALCEQSLSLASGHGDRAGMSQALNYLATVTAAEGDVERARPLYLEALEIAHEIGELLDLRWALDGLGGIACSDGLLELAGGLLAQADAIGTLVSIVLPPPVSQAHDAYVQAVRAGLSARDFEAAWAAGELMTPDQAVEAASALADPDRLVSRVFQHA
jgi:predicted ATPase/DNA-binding SARP family transcriptional activator